MSCLYCKSDRMTGWLSGIRDRLRCAAGEWSFRRCLECGSAVLDPLPSQEELNAFYPPVYSFAMEIGEQSLLKRWVSRCEYRLFYEPMYRRDAQRIARKVGIAATGNKRLLDVGCGRGLRLLALQRQGFEVEGTDVQPEVVEYVQRELGVPARCSDAGRLDQIFEAERFDVVTAYYVIEHVVDVGDLLETAVRLLRPGGWFVGAVPLSDSFQAFLFRSRWSQATEAPRHVSLPSRQGLERVCARVGLEQFSLLPDTLPNCAEAFALSLVPRSSTFAMYGGSRLWALPMRLLGGVATVCAIPWCWAEACLVRRPGIGVFFARKPAHRIGNSPKENL